ncbi:hypothetical protein ACQPZP_34220 [Spirillospora sp. CA-142024]|uniref:hypothetical protein n=1 Tax=Spirillospora sp. CA-142024 TaxID=3240036 RepID=UPI003D8D70A6
MQFDKSTALRPVLADLSGALSSLVNLLATTAAEVAGAERDIASVAPYEVGLLWESLTELHEVVQSHSFRRFTRSVDFGV